MAGAGYKLFNTGDVLLASEVNTYLQQQVTMVFANATARTSALSGVLAEGMMSYLQDTNTVEVYNGTSWVNVGNAGDITEVQAGTGISVASGTGPIPVVTSTVATTFDAKGDLVVGTGADTFAKLTVGTNGYTLVADSSETTGLKWQAPAGGGKVLQVVSTTYSTSTSVSSDTTWTDSGISLSITPSAATSKVLILASYYYRKNGADADAAVDIRLVRGSTAIFTHTRNIATDTTNFHMQQNGMTYLDSPSTTSATTYKIQFKGHTATTVFMQYNSNPSSLILMEIGA